MNTEILSIIGGIAIFFMVFIVFNSDDNMDLKTKKRLINIKNKKVDVKSKKNVSKEGMTELFQSNEYRFAFAKIILEKIKITAEVKKLLKTADMNITVDMFFIISGGLALPFVCLGILDAVNGIFYILTGIILSFIPFVSMKMKIKKRLDLFTKQLPEALGLIANSLRAGHSLISSFQLVATELPYPINQVFRILADDISLGRDTKEALDNMEQSIPGSMDLKFFITAVSIQREIGGNMAEILDSLNATIRERFKLIGQLKAQTAQAKMSGIVLACAPFVIGTAIYFMNPEYLQPLFTTMPGKCALIASGVSAFIGFTLIQKITDIKV